MIRKQFIASAFIGMLCLAQTFGQITDFKLSDYKLPVLKRHYLETEVNLRGYDNQSQREFQLNSGASDARNSDFNGNIYANYSYYLSNEVWQRAIYLNVNANRQLTKSNQDNGRINNYGSYSTSVNARSINRRYFMKNRFIEIDFLINEDFYNSSNYYRDINSELDTWFRNNSVTGFVPLKIGVGRIEQVQDAAKAVYIYNELVRENRVSAGKNKEDIMKFAEQISQIKNIRLFDSRMQRMREIEMLDSFFIANNYVEKSDARYFTTLNDFWLNGNNDQRNSGTRLAFVVFPGYKFRNGLLSSDSYTRSYSVFALNTGIEFDYEKPINLYWQNSLSIKAYGGISKGEVKSFSTVQTENISNVPSLQFGLDYAINYYPNTRTNVGFYCGADYIQLINKANSNTNTLGNGGKLFYTYSSVNMHYYFSPKLSANFYLSLNYSWQNSQDLFSNYATGSAIYLGDNIDNLNYTKTIGTYLSSEFVLKYRIF